MEVVRLGSVESTSTHAAALLAAGKRAPFAVAAEAQTAGRGRRGTAWASPPGNLYLTLALPPPGGPPAAYGTLPLKAGVVIARALARCYGVRVTLKWPNDLLYAGRKLGGLLLEGSTSGRRAGEVLVGIGLNLASAPSLAGSYRATHLAAVLGRPVGVDACLDAVVGAFASDWDAVAAADVAAVFEEYAIGAGQLWRAGRALAQAGRVRADGTFPLSRLATALPARWASGAGEAAASAPAGMAAADAAQASVGAAAADAARASVGAAAADAAPASVGAAAADAARASVGTAAADAAAGPVSPVDPAAAAAAPPPGPAGPGAAPQPGFAAPLLLSSVDHGWRWLYQGDGADRVPLAVADVGNSAVKLAWFSPASAAAPQQVERVAHADGPAALAATLARFAAGAPPAWPLHLVSVNPAAAAEVARAAVAAGLTPLPLAKRPLLRHGDGYELDGLGSDRLAAIEGFLSSLPASVRGDAARFSLVVSAGTATTIDAVGTDGRHLGGLILPGLATALASLHQAASLLPAIDLRVEAAADDPACLGHDTRSAMTQGVMTMTAGAVERVLRRVAAASGRQPAGVGVVVTGGWGEALARALDAPWVPELVLCGARAAALGGWLPATAAGVATP